MSDLNLKPYDPLYPMRVHPYEELLKDQNASVIDKINSIIDYLNSVGKLTSDVVKNWNTVYNWVMNDGLKTGINNKLEDMLAKGEFDTILNTVVTKIGDITTLTTTDKSNLTKAINEIVSKIGNLAKQTDLTNGLALKRDKATKLVMEDMSDTVISAISGGTTVNVLSVPQNGSVTAATLSSDFTFKTTTATRLVDITDTGDYMLSTGNFTDFPFANDYLNHYVKVSVMGARREYILTRSDTSKTYFGYKEWNADTITWYDVPNNNVLHQSRPFPNGVTNLADITQPGLYLIGSGLAIPEIVALGLQYRNCYMNVFIGENNSKTYFLQELDVDTTDDQRTFIGYKSWNGTTVHWKRVLSERDLPLYGNAMCLLGDSIMASLDVSIFAKRTGMTVTNLAKAGSSVAMRNAPDPDWDPWALVTRSKTGQTNSIPIENYKYAMIWMGTNDWGNSIPLGTIDGTDEHTILGAYNVTIQNFYIRNPNLRLMIATPQHRYDMSDTNLMGGATLSDVVNGIISLANKYSIPVLNMFNNSGINTYNKTSLMNTDNLHLSAVGQLMAANKLSGFTTANY